MLNKSYNQMSELDTFDERFRYLKLEGNVGDITFGGERYINQKFYQSKEWKKIKAQVIVRDDGCDLGLRDRPIDGPIYIHHINPITKDDIINASDKVLDPNNLVCVSRETHNALHYGDDSILKKDKIIIRSKNDTCPWRK